MVTLGRFGAIDIHELQRFEKRLIRFWSLAGLPVVLAFLLLATSAGGWNGRCEPSGMTYQSVAGLVPYSDAQIYYQSAFEMRSRGIWNQVAAQRPLTAAMRGALTLGGGMSYVGSFVPQTIAITCFLVFALRALMIWQGIWAAGALLALAFGVIQPFLQGAEMLVLNGAWETIEASRPALFVEIDDKALRDFGSSAAEILDTLTQRNYAPHQLMPKGEPRRLTWEEVVNAVANDYTDVLFLPA